MTAAVERPRIMTHLVAYYPNRELSLTAARAMLEGGASLFEIQFPFSDPQADGRLIQTACSSALEAGFRVEGGFGLVAELRKETTVPIFIMSYANLVVRDGVKNFVERARTAGATGLIVPDLMPGYDEGLYEAGREAGIAVVPVVAPSIGDARLEEVAKQRPRWLYAALRVGITGRYTELGADNRRFLERLSVVGSQLIAGFGIRSGEQVAALSGLVDIAAVGSALVQTIADSCGDTPGPESGVRMATALRRKVGELAAVA